MKKIKQILVILVTIMCIFNFMPYSVHADDDGYYIKHMDVQVKANDKREFKIRETLKVYFNEERHGIIRKIPIEGSLENYKITDVSVVGDPFEKYDGENLELKIGDEDKTIEGDKTYIINYTLKYYDDEQVDGDYIYLNVLGTEWDTYIENFTSTITYPKNATLQKITITDGEYGSKTSTYVNYTTNKNQINIKSKSTIPSYCGVTVNAKLNQGAFKNAPIRRYPYTVKSDIMNAQITEEKKYLINREYIIETNEEREENNLIRIYLWEDEGRDYIKNVSIDNEKINFDSSDNTLILPKEKGAYKFKVTYEVEPVLSGDVNFCLNNFKNEGKIEKLKVSITSPYNMDGYDVYFKEKGVNLGTKRYSAEINNKTLTFSNLNNINVGESISLSIKINNDLFSRPNPFIYYISIIASLIILVLLIFIYIKNRDKEPFISAVEFYPPKDLNSAEVAYAYNQVLINRDIVSLLYYWASDNHIKITINKDDSFKLKKINELDDKHKEYEKTLFEDIFKAGDGKKVTDKDLKDATIDSINDSKGDIKRYFKDERELVDKSSVKKARLIELLPAISILLTFIYDGILSHDLSFSLLVSGALILILLVCTESFIAFSKSNTKNKYVGKKKVSSIVLKSYLLLVYIVVNFIFLKYSELPASSMILTFLVSIMGLVLSGLVIKRTSYGKDILAQIEGFRNFMEVAEKERLEALLEDDPYYFYNTLPYAQVLGVTKKWIDKFDGISMKQPDYYDTYYPMRDIYAINMLNNSLNNVTSTVSKSAYSPSSSDGFDGGGFSGGGGGGGGGSSW